MKNARWYEEQLTELTEEVFAAKDLVDALAEELIVLGLHTLGDVQILALDTVLNATLLAVEKTAGNGDVGVGLESLE